MIGERWAATGLLARPSSPFVAAAVQLLQNSLELVSDADRELRALLAYPLEETLAGEAGQAQAADGLAEVAAAVLAAHESGELAAALQSGHDGYKARDAGGGG